jgi:hypothetical protein
LATFAIVRLKSQLRRLDFPTFDRPATATWGNHSPGWSSGRSDEPRNSTSVISKDQ